MSSFTKQRITPRALLEIKTPHDLALSPLDQKVAYTVEDIDWDKNRQSYHIYISGLKRNAETKQLTRGNSDEYKPEWSPDGKWLAFLRIMYDIDEDEDNNDPKAQIWILPIGDGGEPEVITDEKNGVDAYRWLPDSSGFVYLTEETWPKPIQSYWDLLEDDKDDAYIDRDDKSRMQIWTIDLKEKEKSLIHSGDYGIADIDVAPDGSAIAFTTNYTGEENDYHKVDIWTIPIGDGIPKQITNSIGSRYHIRWSQDSKRIYYMRSINPEIPFSQHNVFSISGDGGEEILETSNLIYDVSENRCFTWDRSNSLYVCIAAGTVSGIYRRIDSEYQKCIHSSEFIHEYAVNKSGDIIYISSDSCNPPEIYICKANGKTYPITIHNEEWIKTYNTAPVDIVKWNSADGQEIEGLLTYPLQYSHDQTYPTIALIHGGPHSRTVQSITSYAINQLLAANGYMVFSPNYRGSDGYGDDFAKSLKSGLGDNDYIDIISGIDFLVDEGLTNPDKLGIMGSSYGGFLVDLAIGRTHRFNAAISAFGIASLQSDFFNSEAPRWEMDYIGATYWDNEEEYRKRSPLTYIKNIETPLLLLHGEEDNNTFITNSQELYNGLRLLGKICRFVRYPREGHGFTEPNHRLDEMSRCISWLNKYLKEDYEHQICEKVTQNGWQLIVTSAEFLPVNKEGKKDRYLNISLIIRDIDERRRSMVITPNDLKLMDVYTHRSLKPVGLPVNTHDQTLIAETRSWRFNIECDKNEKGISGAVSVVFRIKTSSTEYLFYFKDFKPVLVQLDPSDNAD